MTRATGIGETSRDERSRTPPLLVVSAGLLLALLGFAVWGRSDDIAVVGDAYVYRERMQELFSGRVPYFDFTFEHYPLVLVPMVLSWLLGGFDGRVPYGTVFAALMLLCLGGTYVLTRRTGHALGVVDAGTVWLALTLPLLPFVVFRSEPFVVLLAAAALAVALGSGSARGAMLAAVAAKGWPAALALVEWARGRRRRAGLVVAFAIGLTALLTATEGFSEGRRFDGIHMETLPGSIVLLDRVVDGRPPGWVVHAGAEYVDVPASVTTANAVFGVALAGVAASVALRRRVPIAEMPAVVLLAVLGLMLASPLLSPQYLLWVTPFAAIVRSTAIRYAVVAAGALSTAMLLDYDGLLRGRDWPTALLVARNGVLLALCVAVLVHIGRATSRTTTVA